MHVLFGRIDSGDMPDEYIGGGDSIVGMSAEMSADRMKISK